MSQERTLVKTRSAAGYHEAAAAKIIALDSFVDRPGNYVLTKGTFDILHAGHLALFAYCADLASKLEDGGVIAVVESDLSVKKRKGSERPFQGEQTRALQFRRVFM
jgi:cytidyltransferase-like protein